MADPFTLVHDAIWDCLEAYSGFTDLVPACNRIKLTDSNRQPNKDTKASSDYPQVRVVPDSSETPVLRSTSDDGIIVRQYQIQIVTETVLAGGTTWPANIYNIEWNMYRALLNWRDYIKPVTIEDKNGDDVEFVTCVEFGSTEQGVTDPLAAERNSEGIGGWVALFTITVQMYFSRAGFAPTI